MIITLAALNSYPIPLQHLKVAWEEKRKLSALRSLSQALVRPFFSSLLLLSLALSLVFLEPLETLAREREGNLSIGTACCVLRSLVRRLTIVDFSFTISRSSIYLATSSLLAYVRVCTLRFKYHRVMFPRNGPLEEKCAKLLPLSCCCWPQQQRSQQPQLEISTIPHWPTSWKGRRPPPAPTHHYCSRPTVPTRTTTTSSVPYTKVSD